MPRQGLLLQQSVAIVLTIGLLTGLYVVTACFANRWLLFSDEGWKLRKRIHWLMVIVANVLTVLILTATALNIRIPMNQSAFVEDGHTPEQWIDAPWDAIVGCLLSNVIALLADIVLMYRLWVVYDRKLWIISFPIFLWFGGIVCTALQVFLQVVHIHNPNFGPYQWAAVNMTVGPGIVLTPFWTTTITLNGYCTGLLIRQIWRVSERSEDKSSARHLRFLIRILMESGVLYLIISLAHFFVWFGKSNFAIYMLGAMNTSVIGIAFNLVLIRTAQNKMEDEDVKNEVTTEIAFSSQPTIHTEAASSDDSHPTVEKDPRRVQQKLEQKYCIGEQVMWLFP